MFHLAELFQADGKNVLLYGFGNFPLNHQLNQTTDLSTALTFSDIVICPLPFTKDEKHIQAPFHKDQIKIEELIEKTNQHTHFFAGHVPKLWKDRFKEAKVSLVDYFLREELQILNAIATVEGTIQQAMEITDITLHRSSIFIFGYGRIGKLLADQLAGLGAHVSVVVRKKEDIAWIMARGHNPIYYDSVQSEIKNAKLIINTVPAQIMNEEILGKISQEVPILDIASLPGGVEDEMAKSFGIKLHRALGLPGKVAAKSAALYIQETLYNILLEMEASQ